MFDSEIIPLIDVVLQSRLVDADGHVVGEAVSEADVYKRQLLNSCERGVGTR